MRYMTNIVENVTSTINAIITVFDKCLKFQLRNMELFRCMHINRLLYNPNNLTMTVILSKSYSFQQCGYKNY